MVLTKTRLLKHDFPVHGFHTSVFIRMWRTRMWPEGPHEEPTQIMWVMVASHWNPFQCSGRTWQLCIPLNASTLPVPLIESLSQASLLATRIVLSFYSVAISKLLSCMPSLYLGWKERTTGAHSSSSLWSDLSVVFKETIAMINISARSSWKLKDENLQLFFAKFSPHVSPMSARISPEFRSRGCCA